MTNKFAEVEISIPEAMRSIASIALERARYLFPDLVIDLKPENTHLILSGEANLDEAATQVRYALYREYCAARDGRLRQKLIEALLS